jgi:hypothetical protein
MNSSKAHIMDFVENEFYLFFTNKVSFFLRLHKHSQGPMTMNARHANLISINILCISIHILNKLLTLSTKERNYGKHVGQISKFDQAYSK